MPATAPGCCQVGSRCCWTHACAARGRSYHLRRRLSRSRGTHCHTQYAASSDKHADVQSAGACCSAAVRVQRRCPTHLRRAGGGGAAPLLQLVGGGGAAAVHRPAAAAAPVPAGTAAADVFKPAGNRRLLGPGDAVAKALHSATAAQEVPLGHAAHHGHRLRLPLCRAREQPLLARSCQCVAQLRTVGFPQCAAAWHCTL